MTKPAPKCSGRAEYKDCPEPVWRAGRCVACYAAVRRDKKRSKPKRPPGEDLGPNPVEMQLAMPAELGGRFYAAYPKGARARVLRALLREHLDSLPRRC